MAKNEPKPPLTEQQIQVAVNDLGRSPTTMKRFIAQQLMAFAADNNGEIDVTKKEFVDGLATLMTAVQTQSQKDRGIGVLSLAQTEADMTKDIKEAIDRGANPQLFEPAKALLISVKSEVTDKVKSNKGIGSLIGEFIKDQSLANGIPFMDAKTGRGFVPKEKAELVEKLMPYIQFPENVSPFIRKDTTFIPTVVSPKIQVRMAEFFSVEGKLSEFGSCTFDPAKLTPENMKKFGDMVSKDLEVMASVEQSKKEVESKATNIFEQSIKELENKGYKVSPGTKKELAKELMPALTSLGSEYLAANSAQLAKGLTESLNKGKSFSLRNRDKFDIAEKDLQSIATKLKSENFEKSNEAAVERYNAGFKHIPLKTTDQNLTEKLNKFLENRGEKPLSLKQFKELSTKDLALYRKTDPKEFDKLVFGIGAGPVVNQTKAVVKEQPVEVVAPTKPEKLSKTPPPRPLSSPPRLVTPPMQQSLAPKVEGPSADKIAKDIIASSLQAEGHKVTPERVEKITKNLLPALSKLGPEYLEKHKNTLSQELTTSLKASRGYSTAFTGSYTVSTSELGKIAHNIEKHQSKAEAASTKQVEAIAIARGMTGKETLDKLNLFAQATGMTKDGKPVKFGPEVPSPEAVGKMRLSNPQRFDKIFSARPLPTPDLAQKASDLGHKPTPPSRPKPLPPPRPRSRPRSDGISM